MPTVTHQLDKIREQAARWVDRQFAGSLSEEKLAEFDIWQRADECHEECVRMATASGWAERMRDGDLPVPEREAFTRWLLADARNMEEFRLAALLLMMGNDLCHAEKQGRERNLPQFN
jgi:ferric-dicitrate binding protein FerR (iron transport regulator)